MVKLIPAQKMKEQGSEKRQRPTKEDKLVFQYIEQIEQGDETLIKRIRETLEIDSETNPTPEQIREFISLQRERRHVRGHN